MDARYDLLEKMSFPRDDFPIRFIYNQWTHKKILFEHHWHRQLEFLYVVRGRLCIQCGAQKYSITGGQAALVNSNQVHFAQCLSESAEYYVIVVDPGFICGSASNAVQAKYIAPIFDGGITFPNKITDPAVIQCITGLIEELKQKTDGYELMVQSSFLRFLGLLVRLPNPQGSRSMAVAQTEKKLEKLLCVLEFIRNNYTYEISLETLAEMTHVSVSHFCRMFKSVTGETPVEYMNKIRLNKSCELLMTSDRKITEIALLSGFSNSAYFCRTFKKQFMVTPSEYRAHNRKEAIHVS